MKPTRLFNKVAIAKTGKDILNLLLSKEKPLNGFSKALPTGDIEIALFSIWKSLLGHGDFFVNDDFFQLGGNSIKAVQLVSRISKEYTISIQLTDIFLQPTISQLAALIKERQKEKTLIPLGIKVITPRPSYIPLSFSQERLWFIDQMEGSVQYHMSAVLGLKGSLNKKALEYALQSMVDRHEVLRTVFVEEGGQPFQLVQKAACWQLPVVEDAK
ncbi:MAG: condensation domain-containing protein, partial [Chitinophagaceae bacterium]